MANQMTISSNGTQMAAAAPEGEIKIMNYALAAVTRLTQSGRLHLPDDYSVGNAIKAAELLFPSIQDRNNKPIFAGGRLTGIVTQESVANALMDMVTQGLNPAKKQGYFIVYGQSLIWQRSYFGDMALAARLRPGIEFYYDTIQAGDDFACEKSRTRRGMVTTIERHKQPFPRGKEVLGAYCGAVDGDGTDLGCEVMDIARIRQSWAKSKTASYENSTHKQFEGEMAIRTVVRHYCKAIINSSSDELLMATVRRSDLDSVEAEVTADAAQYANREMLPAPPAREAERPTLREPEPVAGVPDDGVSDVSDEEREAGF